MGRYRLRIKRNEPDKLRNMSPILTNQREKNNLSFRKIPFMRNSNNQTSVFEVSTVYIIDFLR